VKRSGSDFIDVGDDLPIIGLKDGNIKIGRGATKVEP